MSTVKVVRSLMTSYWKEFADQATLNQMMLDSRAEELNKEERPEILSYLPDYTGKRIIELGAGIGRFTSEIAPKAKSVVAVDFMQDFIQKNEETNKHFGNIEFLCADVTHLTREKESADLIFSNWLLMYLDNSEVQSLLTKLLTWLAPGGYLFIRESCRHASGDHSRQQNPTQYRDPSHYEAFLASVTIPVDEKNVYGYDMVLSKCVETYIKHKNNCNQVVWLVQKVLRDTSKTHGFKTFQEFLDNQQYSSRGILCYEKIFGRTFVSTGGLETTKEFVGLLNLQKGQKVLDVGGGIGGSAFYMAKEFGVQVVSIDLSSNMTQIGMDRAQELGITPDQVSFEIADATKRDYPPQSFDVIYSRDTILHIEDKLSLFKQFFKWLKPGGRVLISDYCCSEGPHSDQFKAYVKQRGYNLLTPAAYGKVLEEAGFVKVRAEDRSQQFLQVLQRELHTTQTIRQQFIQEFSEEDYNYIIDGWKAKIERVGEGDQRWGLFYAEKQ
ncbi:uncharacterized protein LOC143286185 isoform X2 [Babylonia areolata]|uniref:uncharacterized protein LOC143286185 isoform X2 n=1 Tax=Babylonia areolata TaxID=304850 RepID=UPI003FD5E478